MPANFIPIGEPAHDAERQALRFLVEGLPAEYTVYGNAWLVERSGVIYELDAVVVATSVRLHHPMCKAALLAGKHVLVEKPMAASSAECDDLDSIARSKGLTLMVGHTFLYSPIVRRIKKIVDDGDIGEIRYISARRLNLGLFQKDINVTWDLAPHDLSIILYILGENPISARRSRRRGRGPGTGRGCSACPRRSGS